MAALRILDGNPGAASRRQIVVISQEAIVVQPGVSLARAAPETLLPP
jgi:hypothetical protein